MQNFPFDIQELSITISSKLNNNDLNLIPNEKRLSNVTIHASNTFVEQQKWFLFFNLNFI